MRRQNEKLEEARQSGFKIYNQVDSADKKAVELEYGASAFDPIAGLKTRVKNWVNDDGSAKQDIEYMQNRQIPEEDISNDFDKSVELNLDGTNAEKQTNQELAKILALTRNIRKETEIQSRVGKKQETKLNDIAKTTDYSRKKAEEATNRLEENL